MPISDEEAGRLAELHWRRWRNAISARDPRAQEALDMLMTTIARTQGRRKSFGDVTPRERELLTLLAHGHRIRGAAERMGIAEETAKSHLKNARFRLGARNIEHAVAEAIRHGVIE